MAVSNKKSFSIKFYDNFVYTDANGNQQVLQNKGKDSIRPLFDKKKLVKEVNLYLQNWYLELSKLQQIKSVPKQVEHYVQHMFFLEKQIHNFGYVMSDELKIVSLNDVKAFKNYKPFLNGVEISLVNKLYSDYADDLTLFSVLRDKVVTKAFILQIDSKVKRVSEYKFTQSDVNDMLDELAFNKKQPLPRPIIEMQSVRSTYQSRFKRWLKKRYQDRGHKSFDKAMHNHFIDLESRLDNIKVKGGNRLLPITALADSKIFQRDEVHIQILMDIWGIFKRWFNRKNTNNLKIDLTPIGTDDANVPHIFAIDKDYAIKIAKDNKLQKDLDKRVLERDTEAYKDKDIDEMRELVKANDPFVL